MPDEDGEIDLSEYKDASLSDLTVEELKDFVYNGFCGANLSKYMIEASKLEGKTMVCLKPCDTYSFNQLLTEHRFDREKVYAVGIPCEGITVSSKLRGCFYPDGPGLHACLLSRTDRFVRSFYESREFPFIIAYVFFFSSRGAPICLCCTIFPFFSNCF